jgi:hypothetical protein
MSRLRDLVILGAIVIMPFPALAQEGKLVVENLVSKELKRSAHRMGLSIDQLKKARSTLQEATDLFLRMKPIQSSQVSNLGYLWMQGYRAKAQTTLESIFRRLKNMASTAEDAAAYQSASAAAQTLMYTYSQLDPENALQMASQWPDPPSSFGDAGTSLQKGMRAPLQELLLQRLITQDPERALGLLPEVTTGQRNYGITGRLAQQMALKGNRDQALALIDQAIADFQQQSPSAGTLRDFAGLVQQLPDLDPKRFLLAVQLLSQPMTPTASEDSSLIEIAGGTIAISSAESTMLSILRGLANRPELAIAAFNQMPGLKSKLERVGGIDGFLNRAAPAAYSSAGTAGGSGGKRNADPVPSGEEKPPASLLYSQLRGKSIKNPMLVRQQLSNAIKDPNQVHVLLSLAQMAYSEDPDLGALALEVAEPLVFQIQVLQPRVAALQNLIQAYRTYEGEVDVNLLREGYILAAKIRAEEQPAKSEIPADRFYSAADPLEALLISQTARQDCDAALRYVRTISNDTQKFNLLVQIVQSLQTRY